MHLLKKTFSSDYFVKYYENYRCRYDELFPSEKRFMREFLRPGKAYLDVGCARGGFYEILGERVVSFKYTGVDISPALISAARREHRGAEFQCYDGARLPFPDNSYDNAVCLGITVHDPKFMRVIRECYRVANQRVLFDIRLMPHVVTLAHVAKAYVLDGAGPKYPYVVCNYGEFMSCLRALEPKPAAIKIYGYWSAPNKNAKLPRGYERVCTAGVLLEKGTGAGTTKMSVELPFRAPARPLRALSRSIPGLGTTFGSLAALTFSF